MEGGGCSKTKEEWVEILTGLLSRLYTESLQCRPRERKVIVCESMVSPRALREAVAHILFRFLQVPSLHLCAGPAPALFCTGLDTGMVLDVGRSEAHVVAVYRGSNLTSSYAGVPLGCRAVQARIGELIEEEEEEAAAAAGEGEAEAGATRRPLTSRELEDVVVRASLVPVGGVPSADQVSPMEFVFPGRRRVSVSGGVRTTAVQQAFFEGDEEGRTLATLVLDCLKRCPRDCRRAVAQNVVVAGGGALLPGLPARLAQEIEALTADTDAGADADPALAGSGGYSWARACVTGHGQHEELGSIDTAGTSATSCDDGGASSSGSARAGAGGGEHGAGGGESQGRQGGAGKGLCVVQVPVRRDLLVWTGASIMASLGSISRRCLTSEQYLARAAGGGWEGLGDGGREGCLPDWMSVSPADWVFEAAASPMATV